MLVVWILAWVAHALATSPGTLFDANINHPAPLQLTGSDHFLSYQLLFGPLWSITDNPVLATNLLIALTYPIAGTLMYQLLRKQEVRSALAWVAGLVFALGPLRVPPSVVVLQVCGAWLPLVALSVRRVRRRPGPGAAAMCALALIASFFSSYYMAVMALVTAGTWAIFELRRLGRERWSFVGWAALSATVALTCLVLFTGPYLFRAASVSPGRPPALSVIMSLFVLQSGFFGLPLLVVSPVVGLLAFTQQSSRLRSVALVGLALWLIGTSVALFGGPLMEFGLPSLSRFFRASDRFLVVAGFGATVTAAAGLEALSRQLPSRVAAVLIAAVAVGVVLMREPALANRPTWQVRAVGNRRLYATIGDTITQMGGGALLELPLRGQPDPQRHTLSASLVREAMIGSIYHWLPLLTGFTGYQPPHYRLLLAMIVRLPDPEAFATLVDMTHVRWVLLRAPADWMSPDDRERILRGLTASHDVEPIWSAEGWTLLLVRRTPRHPEWFAAIAAGTRLDATVLGTPLQPLRPGDAVGVVESAHELPTVRPRARFALPLVVRNAGRATWPVVAPAKLSLGGFEGLGPTSTGYTVELVAHWHAVPGGPPPRQRPSRITLARDIPAGETLRAAAFLSAPTQPGAYLLEVRPRQVRGTPFRGTGNVPSRVIVTVGDPSRVQGEISSDRPQLGALLEIERQHDHPFCATT
jgi:hypothetical protein